MDEVCDDIFLSLAILCGCEYIVFWGLKAVTPDKHSNSVGPVSNFAHDPVLSHQTEILRIVSHIKFYFSETGTLCK